MSSRPTPSPAFQRNALAPGILAAIVCIAGIALVDQELYLVARFIIAILAVIIGWFAAQARQWWWIVPMLAIAVVWNPLYPIVFDGPWWIGANIAATATFLSAGAMIKTPRPMP
ncbi:DUF6804 family protein [Microbacterium sp. NPDC055357]